MFDSNLCRLSVGSRCIYSIPIVAAFLRSISLTMALRHDANLTIFLNEIYFYQTNQIATASNRVLLSAMFAPSFTQRSQVSFPVCRYTKSFERIDKTFFVTRVK